MKKNKDGYYVTKVKIGNDINGKPINKWIRSKTLKGIEQEKARIHAVYIDGHATADDSLFGTYAALWFNEQKSTLAVNSIHQYTTVLRNHLLPYLGEKHLKAVLASDVSYLISVTPKSYKRTAKSILNMVFTKAVNDRILVYNPVSNIQKSKKKKKSEIINETTSERRGLTLDERAKLLKTFNPKDDISLCLIIAYYFGLRAGEIMGLKWGDFDWAKGILYISRQYQDLVGDVLYPKTFAGVREVPIPRSARNLLYDVKRGNDDYVLYHGKGKSVYSRYNYHVRRIFRRLYPYEKVTMHWLRHNYICMCWEHKVDVYATAKIVGHSNVMVTLRIYNHLSEQLKKEGHDIIRKMF